MLHRRACNHNCSYNLFPHLGQTICHLSVSSQQLNQSHKPNPSRFLLDTLSVVRFIVENRNPSFFYVPELYVRFEIRERTTSLVLQSLPSNFFVIDFYSTRTVRSSNSYVGSWSTGNSCSFVTESCRNTTQHNTTQQYAITTITRESHCCNK